LLVLPDKPDCSENTFTPTPKGASGKVPFRGFRGKRLKQKAGLLIPKCPYFDFLIIPFVINLLAIFADA